MNVILSLLLEITLALSVVLVFILNVRRLMARYLGPASAYALWLIAPAAIIATLLPERTRETVVADFLVQGLPPGLAVLEQNAANSLLSLITALVWITGAVAMGARLAHQQRAFQKEVDSGRAGPAITGLRYPRIVVPDDFEARFSYCERRLILAHEQVHLDRHDVCINAVVALARCLLWFNPIVHIAAVALRADQELSCDAEVVARRPRMRRTYAETLLKAQAASPAPPVACLWQTPGQHPLTDRIQLLAQQPASARRRRVAAFVVAALIVATAGSVWAGQPERRVFRETETILAPVYLIRERQELREAAVETPVDADPGGSRFAGARMEGLRGSTTCPSLSSGSVEAPVASRIAGGIGDGGSRASGAGDERCTETVAPARGSGFDDARRMP